jgi:hypothetical protein
MTTLTVTVPRMTRATWYKHRVSVLGIPAVFLLAALLLWIDGAVQRHWLSAHHLTGCLVASSVYGGSVCNSGASVRTALYAQFYNPFRTNITEVEVLVLPALVGLFAGVPWVAREFESGAFRFTWTQSISGRRWLLGTFVPLTLLAVVTAAVYGIAAHWWFQVAQWRSGASYSAWSWQSFELTPLSMLSWTLLTMSLALLLGVMIRRVLPAMIALVVTLGVCALLTQTWLREHLFSLGTVVRQASWGTGSNWPFSSGTYVAQTWFRTPSGQRLSVLTAFHQTGTYQGSLNVWIAQHHYTYWVAYQPYSHRVWLELARNGILVAIAALAVFASVRWLRIRPAE